MNSVFGVTPVIESTSSIKDLTRSRIPLSCLLCLCELVFKRPAAMKVHAVKCMDKGLILCCDTRISGLTAFWLSFGSLYDILTMIRTYFVKILSFE